MLFKKKKVEDTPEPRLYNVVNVHLDKDSKVKQIYRNRSRYVCMDFEGGISLGMYADTALELRKLFNQCCDDLERYADDIKEGSDNIPFDQIYSISE